MRIEGKCKGGKPTKATIRKENFKTEQVLGRKAVQKLKDRGNKSLLKKNLHGRIGGHKGKLEKEWILQETRDHIEEQMAEVEQEIEDQREASDPTFKTSRLTRGQKDSLKMLKRMFS